MLRCFTLPAYRTLKEEDADVQGPVRVAVADCIDRTSGGRTLGKKSAALQSTGSTKSPKSGGPLGRRRGDQQSQQQQQQQQQSHHQQQQQHQSQPPQQRSLLSGGVVSEGGVGGVLRRARTGAGASGAAQGPGAGPAPSFVRHLEANLRRKEDPALLHQGSSVHAAGDDAALLADGAERYTRLPQGSACVSSSPPQCQAPPTPASPAPSSRTSSSNGPSAVITSPSSSASSPVPAVSPASNLAAPSPPPPLQQQPEASRSPAPRGRTSRMATGLATQLGSGPSRAPPQPHPAPSGFVSRPARGWLHTDQQVLGPGVTYAVRYIGCLDVKMSMKSLDFDTRSLIAKECITRVCEAAGLRPVDKKRKVDRRLQRMLADRPNLDYAGSNVTLCVTSSNLTLAVVESGQVIADHSMPNISFASAGDTETLDFVAYVAKDGQNARACFVLECSGGVLAQDVISTIGHAFELRFREFMRTAPPPGLPPKRPETVAPSKDDPDYYNDLPGKIPPEAPPPPVPPLPDYRTEPTTDSSKDPLREALPNAPVNLPPQPNARKVSRDTNLIDLSGEELPPVPIVQRHEYVNMGQDTGMSKNGILDPFDMPPVAPPPGGVAQEEAWHRATLEREVWFHGAISRKEGESRLAHDGDFLVRESHNSPGQFVLTGMQNGARRHLLLVDPAGVVRTKDRTFDSVSHLVNFHRDNALPIISAESALILKTPVPRPR
ncbi:SHC-transforming protein 1 isoform X1 [Dermacentor albipictus]|uniref:SHC-transforming protein 1 isoform X1 n=2 Tax=Dermacentor albipictus TaxID=60249 RepID=UPI0031FBD3ED